MGKRDEKTKQNSCSVNDSEKQPFRSGFVALVGRPNAGKSTLLNALVGEKIAITSNVAQTTRHRLRGIVNRDNLQMVIVDTPGLHKPHDALGEEVNRSAVAAIKDVDVIAFLIDASMPVGGGDRWVADLIARSPKKTKKVLVLTKIDKVDQDTVRRQSTKAVELGHFDAIVATSATQDFNLEGFINEVSNFFDQGPQWFTPDMDTDQSLEVMISEFIREKVLYNMREEVPHAVGVVVEDIDQNLNANLTRIWATIYIERDSQKGMIIGKGGSMLKKIGTSARIDLEKLLGTTIYLNLSVKVKKDWRRDAAQIRRFGYGEGL